VLKGDGEKSNDDYQFCGDEELFNKRYLVRNTKLGTVRDYTKRE
jgi:hypothetical protein